MGKDLFSTKSSYILGRKRTRILFEGYEITELDEFSVSIVYGIEMDSLGGLLSSPFFTRLYYYRLFMYRVSDLLFFDESPDEWLAGTLTRKISFARRIARTITTGKAQQVAKSEPARREVTTHIAVIFCL